MAFDWLLVSRYALLVALCELIPVPLLDGWVSNLVRRRLTHVQLAQHGQSLPSKDVRMLSDAGAGGCLGILWSLIVWPFKKLLRTVLFVLQLNKMVNVFSEVAHRALNEDATEFIPPSPDKLVPFRHSEALDLYPEAVISILQQTPKVLAAIKAMSA